MLDVPTTGVAYVKVTPTISNCIQPSDRDQNHLAMWIGRIAIQLQVWTALRVDHYPVASVDRPLLSNTQANLLVCLSMVYFSDNQTSSKGKFKNNNPKQTVLVINNRTAKLEHYFKFGKRLLMKLALSYVVANKMNFLDNATKKLKISQIISSGFRYNF